MREIKFRVWDKLEKKYSRGPYWTINVNGYLDYGNAHWKDEAALEQYTGLKDRNGKEIYEGDIVLSMKRKFKMVYNFQSFKLKCLKTGELFLVHHNGINEKMECKDLELIGNIHENKELLEGELCLQ